MKKLDADIHRRFENYVFEDLQERKEQDSMHFTKTVIYVFGQKQQHVQKATVVQR